MVRIEHIGIAVKELDKANELFTRLFGEQQYKEEGVESEHVTTSFFKVGPNKIELLEASSPDSAIAKYVDKRGEGIHHLCFEVPEILRSLSYLDEQGVRVINSTPSIGAEGFPVAFLHPKSCNGVLVELLEPTGGAAAK